MENLISLCTGASYDTNKKAVEKGQVIQLNGYGYSNDEYAVYDIVNGYCGLSYKLINLQTNRFSQTETIRPLSKKHGIGYYFDDASPRFLDGFEIAALRGEAERLEREEQQAKDEEQQRKDALKVIG